MGEPKTFASLSSGLLARKGGATPAMRRPTFGNIYDQAADAGHDDLGWNDMGDSSPSGNALSAAVGLSPMGMPSTATPELAPVPAVVEQRIALEERVAAQAVAPTSSPAAKSTPKPSRRARSADKPSAVLRSGKAAFTLRLDPERHLKLRLSCAVENRSAQQIVTEALDIFLAQHPELDVLANRIPRGSRTQST